jgi:hypothetical protein
MTAFVYKMAPFLRKPKSQCALTQLLRENKVHTVTGTGPTFLSCFLFGGQICMFINSRAKPEEQGLINTQENEAENSVMMK